MCPVACAPTRAVTGPVTGRQKRMELDEPLTRLSLVRPFLEPRQVI